MFKCDKDEIYKILRSTDDQESYETVFHQLNDINSKIVDIAKEVSDLRKGKA